MTHIIFQANVNGSTYLSEKKIGKGTYGDVYLMKNINYTDVKLALKITKPMIGEDPNVMLQEAVLLQSLQHDNIIKYVDSYLLHNGVTTAVYICTEYCINGDLHSYINNNIGKSIPEWKLLIWTKQIASGLQYIHGRGKIHRDIKSGNILFDADMNMKICDFGLARAIPPVDQVTQATMTMTLFVGTPLYMSPEMFKRFNYNKQTDIYSLGAVMYEMAHMVDGGIMQLQNLYSDVHLSGKKNIRLSIPGYSEQLRSLVARMMNDNPDNRPTATGILDDPIFQNTGPPPIIISSNPLQAVQQPIGPGQQTIGAHSLMGLVPRCSRVHNPQ